MSLLKRLQEKGVALDVKEPDKREVLSSTRMDALGAEILETFYKEMDQLGEVNEATLRGYFASRVLAKGKSLTTAERALLLEQILAEVIGLSVLEPYLSEPEVKGIKISEEGKIFLEKGEQVVPARLHFQSKEHLRKIADRFMQHIESAIQEGNFALTSTSSERALTLSLPFSLQSFLERRVIGPSTAAFLEAFSIPQEGEVGFTLDLGRLLFLYKG